jgi:uncharacterized protein YigE (DUF2233 family)
LRAAVLILAVLAGSVAGGTAQSQAPRASAAALSVWHGGEWHQWWRSDSAPARWTAPHPLFVAAIQWQTAAPGVEWTTLRLSGAGEAWRLSVVVARIDPREHDLRLDVVRRRGGRTAPWSVSRAERSAAVAFNAGHFSAVAPWGWVVMEGREVLSPGRGPLSSAVLTDSTGRVHVVPADSIDHYRRSSAVVTAIQSYPTVLLGDGNLPEQLRLENRGVSHTHRDARLGIGVARDGRVLIALTRFEALNGRLDLLPFGPTIPEMAAIMGALGAAQAVLLDGGISSQLAIREAGGRVHSWRAIRQVPLGMVFVPRRPQGAPARATAVESGR